MAHPKDQEPMEDKRPADFGYTEEFPPDWSACRELLETYSKIPAAEVEDHIRAVRSKAFAVYPYPCVGRFAFLDMSVSHHPLYPTILSRLKTGTQTYLDFGCCFGQDLRKLTADGAPSDHMYGADLRLEFLSLGYELFRDRDTLQARFVEGDVFARSQGDEKGDAGLKAMDGMVDIIHAASFFHLFDWDEQLIAAVRLTQFFKADAEDAIIVGRQVGSVNPGPYLRRTHGQGTSFRHDESTFQRLWDEVGEKVGRKFTVKATQESAKEWAGHGRDLEGTDMSHIRLFRFEVHRV